MPSAPPPAPTAAPSATDAPVASPARFPDQCRPGQLRLSPAGYISEPTGQRTLGLLLTNASATGCFLDGYPGVSILDSAGNPVPFRFVWGADQMITSAAPKRVDIAPGAQAAVTINKYRCDLRVLGLGYLLRLIPPNDYAPIEMALPGGAEYCGPGDPGSTYYVSPVEPSTRETLKLG